MMRIAFLLALGVSTAVAGPRSSRGDGAVLWLYNVHTHEELRVRPFTRGSRLATLPWRQLNRLFRSWRTGQRRTIHPRLVRVLLRLQQHFGGRRIELVSGYRVPDKPDGLSSYHQVGRAADVRIAGVDKRELFEYCRALQAEEALGCGYYPNTTFVHIDVRGRSGVWVDVSASGEGREYVRNARAWLRRHGR